MSNNLVLETEKLVPHLQVIQCLLYTFVMADIIVSVLPPTEHTCADLKPSASIARMSPFTLANQMKAEENIAGDRGGKKYNYIKNTKTGQLEVSLFLSLESQKLLFPNVHEMTALL